MKRGFDFLIALAALILLAPALVLIAAAVWLTDFHSPISPDEESRAAVANSACSNSARCSSTPGGRV